MTDLLILISVRLLVFMMPALVFDRSSFQAGCPTLGSRGELWPVTGQVGERQLEEKGGVGEEQEEQEEEEEEEVGKQEEMGGEAGGGGGGGAGGEAGGAGEAGGEGEDGDGQEIREG